MSEDRSRIQLVRRVDAFDYGPDVRLWQQPAASVAPSEGMDAERPRSIGTASDPSDCSCEMRTTNHRRRGEYKRCRV